MKTFEIKEVGKTTYIKLPTSLKEISNDYLNDMVKNINISKYHVVIACIYRAKLPEIISTSKKSRALSTSIVPVFVKCNLGDYNDTIFDKVKTGDKLIISGTDIERGQHLVCPNNFITIENVVNVYNHSNDFAKGVMTDQNYYYFVDFKLVPITDIKGYYSDLGPVNYSNDFVEVVTNDNNIKEVLN